MSDATAALAKLREPFPPNQISKLPKETRAQIDARKADKNLMVWKCPLCGGPHHKNAAHLDYVGHAAATDRLLDTDPAWTWEPLSVDQRGLPAFDETGGLWIRLSVCGVSRLGYGSADGKSGGDAKKEIIGDAIRNAGMRFGMALDLWHKGDLHAGDEPDAAAPRNDPTPIMVNQDQRRQLMVLGTAKNVDTRALCKAMGVQSIPQLPASKYDAAVAWINALPSPKPAEPEQPVAEMLEDEIPY